VARSLSPEGNLATAVCATIAGCDDFNDIVAWGEHHLDFLRQFSEFHHGIPCERWLRSIINRADPLDAIRVKICWRTSIVLCFRRATQSGRSASKMFANFSMSRLVPVNGDAA
jgi:hypothetical protein